MLALIAGWALSQIRVQPGSFLARIAFQGTADDARSLLIEVTGTVITVIALTLGLTVVALQLSSTQFSPRLLRNFLRDRGTQVVLSVFIATFVYSAAGSVSRNGDLRSWPVPSSARLRRDQTRSPALLPRSRLR